MPDTAGRQHTDTAAITAALNEVCLDDLEISLDELLAGREEWAKHHASAQMLIVADGLAQLAAAAAAAQRRADEATKDHERTWDRLVAARKREEAAVAWADRLEPLVTLVRFGFLVTIGGRRASASDVNEPALRNMLMTILGARDTAAALAALAPAHVNDGADYDTWEMAKPADGSESP